MPEALPAPADLALLAWIEQQQGRIWRYLRLLGACPTEAEDIVQDVFVRVLERRGKEPLHQLGPMLRVVARNILLDQRRSKDRRRFVSWCDTVEQWLATQPQALDDDRIAALSHCLRKLTPRARRAIEAHHVHGQTLAEVGRQNQLGMEGARALLRRAREQLRKCADRLLRNPDLAEGEPRSPGESE